MLKRRRLVIAVVGAGLVATFLLPEFFWRVAGWIKNESFYQGRPTTWWVREIRWRYAPFNTPDRQLHVYSTAEVASDPGPALRELQDAMQGPYHVSFAREHVAPWYEESLNKITIAPRLPGVVYQSAPPPLVDGDPEALGVLTELLINDDVKCRQLAACGLGALGKTSRSAVPTLRDRCHDADPTVSMNARWALSRIE